VTLSEKWYAAEFSAFLFSKKKIVVEEGRITPAFRYWGKSTPAGPTFVAPLASL
jgi:hypothetical protein